MDFGVFRTRLLLWLLPGMVTGGLVRRTTDEQEEMPCSTYTLDGLIYLDCNERGLSELPEGLNYESQVLILTNNNFATFPSQLESFTRVQVLDLSGNHLNVPLPSYIENWTSLNTLNLSNNNYESWLNDGRQYKFRRLDLSRNKIKNIEEDSFSGMTNLYFLDLSENRINEFSPKLLTAAKSLNTLRLSRNYLSELPKFQSNSLRSLHLSYCLITNLQVDSLSEMTSLLEIDLSSNQIESIPDNFSSNTLQELDLSYNEIGSLTDRTFSSLPHLAVLNLRGNEFREVWSTSHFASNPFLREVHVKGNRWNCEGFSVNLLLTYEFLTKEPSKIHDRASLICYAPSNVTQLSWQQAYIQTWHPNASTVESYTTLAAMVGIIIGIVVTSLICRGIIAINKPDPPRPETETTIVNLNGTPQSRAESVVMRVPLRDEDLPPTYDEALLMPRLNSSFHSLPDFVDDEPSQRSRRSRSIGDLTEHRPRVSDRRSVRRTVEIHIT